MKSINEARKIKTPDGLDVYYWVTYDSRNHNKPLVVIHTGLANNHTSIEAFERGLNQRGHPTINFDPRGVGYSDAPTTDEYYSLDRFSNDLQQIVEQESLEKPELLGYSLGGAPVMDYVSRTGNCRRFTGVCTSSNFHDSAPHLFGFSLATLFKHCKLYAEYPVSALGYLWSRLSSNKRDYSDQSKEGCSDFSIWLSMNNIDFNHIRANHEVLKQLLTWDLTDQIKRIKSPILLIHGTKDFMVRPRAGDRIKKHSKGRCDIEVLNILHSALMTKPEKVLEVMDRYNSHDAV
jgi:pimeloyl-ACP methyl ester carboxylesterase